MASLIRNIHQFTKKTLTISYRSIHSTVNSEIIEDTSIKDQPINLEKNPYEKQRRLCILCSLNIEPDFKNVRLLSQFQSVYTGRIYGRHITGLCKEKQKRLETEILKAQHAGMMGYYEKAPKYGKDPKIFDPDHPFRRHKY